LNDGTTALISVVATFNLKKKSGAVMLIASRKTSVLSVFLWQSVFLVGLAGLGSHFRWD